MLFASAFQTWQIVGDGSGDREVGGRVVMVCILPLSASSHEGGGWHKKISYVIRESLKKYLRKKIKIPNQHPQPINYEWFTYKISPTQSASLHYTETKLKLLFSCVNGLGPLATHCGKKKKKKIGERSEPSPQSTPWPASLSDFFSCLILPPVQSVVPMCERVGTPMIFALAQKLSGIELSDQCLSSWSCDLRQKGFNKKEK